MAAMHPPSAPPALNLDGEEKRERKKEKTTAATQPIFSGSILTLHSMSPNPWVSMYFLLSIKTQVCFGNSMEV
ncbi:hypothetical protein RHMOL_Rhmol12G0111800 [Rhododendron molle]|uniref:Uncharacterized protein n=1 Tax=Rhododendron molle TaxID=49168 RepID=A0ACC0LHS7_RHOML|nr:hypothetical protein RHMOL_Rhmol12G0111800 [Rhododendron molle]